jgi:predicted dehydrogenase
MGDALRGVVIGAGWAGEGHTLALRAAGVDVVALCARRPSAAAATAARLGIPEASADWRTTLATRRPDVVALATPAALRGPVIDAAAELGCHVYCDKPLATTAAEARRLYERMAATGLKHAYAATHGLEPSAVWLGELLRSGLVGALREIEVGLRLGPPAALKPWSWNDSLAAGGGLLNQGFTHLLAVLQTVTGGRPLRVVGHARALRDRAPVVPEDAAAPGPSGRAPAPTPEAAAALEWRACDADHAYWALLEFAAAPPAAAPVPVTITASLLVRPVWPPNTLRVYGDAGLLLAEGLFAYEVSRQAEPDAPREPLPVPPRLVEALPRVSDRINPYFGAVENKWAALARDFVADVRGEPGPPYLTFRDGWRFQEAIDAIRAARGWTDLPG